MTISGKCGGRLRQRRVVPIRAASRVSVDGSEPNTVGGMPIKSFFGGEVLTSPRALFTHVAPSLPARVRVLLVESHETPQTRTSNQPAYHCVAAEVDGNSRLERRSETTKNFT